MMEEELFKSFYEQTSRPLLAYLLRTTGDKAMADDVFQESYIRLLQREFESVDPARQKAYLFATATNIVRDRWRSMKREREWEEENPPDGAPVPIEDTIDLQWAVDDALQGLSPQQRSLLWLAYVEGYRHDEIASMLNLREKSVRVLLFRARQKLSALLGSRGIRKEEVL